MTRRTDNRSHDLPKVRCPRCRGWMFSGWLIGEIKHKCGYVLRQKTFDKEKIEEYLKANFINA